MSCLRSLWVGLTILVLFTHLGATVPHPAPYGLDCQPRYNITKYKLDFESPPCVGTCPPSLDRLNISTPRGQGVPYLKTGEMERPLLIPNLGGWQVIQCKSKSLSSKDERFACANKSNSALYSPGKSPWDGSKPTLNTEDFPDIYIQGAVEAIHFTPLRLPAGTKKATLQLTGIKISGKRFSHDIVLDISSSSSKTFFLSGLKAKGFTDLKALQLWLVVNGKGGYEFALDDLDLEEYRVLPLPIQCPMATPTFPIDKGPCTPAASKTTTWTADAEEFSKKTDVPLGHKSLTWNSFTTVLNRSTLNTISPFWPKDVSTKNGNFYSAYSPFQVSAYSSEMRFGVTAVDLVCEWKSSSSDSPCAVTFVGRRDPYDGSGLPNFIIANYTIPNPGRYATTQKFTRIDLSQLSDSPGQFSELYSFTIYALIEKDDRTRLLIDNLVFTRSAKKDLLKCRSPGGKELNFDDIKVGSTVQKMSPTYRQFTFSDAWGVTSRNNYKPGTPGHLGAISPPNELWTGWGVSPGVHGNNSIGSYIDPSQNFLFDFEELTFTLDLPEYFTNKSVLKDVVVTVTAEDACGEQAVPYADFQTNPYFGNRSFVPDKLPYTFAEPIHAISSVEIRAFRYVGSVGEVRWIPIQLFMDDFKYRIYKGKTPGCASCGKSSGWCEVPQITPR